jgi:hypothetical protein
VIQFLISANANPAEPFWPSLNIGSWQAFVSYAATLAISSKSPGFACRGQADAQWPLIPSPRRVLPPPTAVSDALLAERRALREFKGQAHLHLPTSYLPRDTPKSDVPSWWSLMQHYQAPTRLLDWTRSPYVAAYFAVESLPELDGAMYVVDLNTIPPRAEGTTNTKYQNPSAPHRLEFFTGITRTERMVAQLGCFSVSLNVLTNHGDWLLDKCSRPGGTADSGPVRRWIFPAAVKGEMLRHLRTMNIAAHSLFPGADGLGRSVAEVVRLG